MGGFLAFEIELNFSLFLTQSHHMASKGFLIQCIYAYVYGKVQRENTAKHLVCSTEQ